MLSLLPRSQVRKPEVPVQELKELYGQGAEEEGLAYVGGLALDLQLVVGVELQLHDAGQRLPPPGCLTPPATHQSCK